MTSSNEKLATAFVPPAAYRVRSEGPAADLAAHAALVQDLEKIAAIQGAGRVEIMPEGMPNHFPNMPSVRVLVRDTRPSALIGHDRAFTETYDFALENGKTQVAGNLRLDDQNERVQAQYAFKSQWLEKGAELSFLKTRLAQAPQFLGGQTSGLLERLYKYGQQPAPWTPSGADGPTITG